MDVLRSAAPILCAIGIVTAPALSQPSAPTAARFDLEQTDALVDEVIPIRVSGLTPGAAVTIHLHGGLDDGWTSSATFTADRDGKVDVTRMAPSKGSYKDVDAMGLFWSLERARTPSTDAAEADDEDERPSPDRWSLTADVDNAIVARATVRRRAVAADVRVTPVHANGLH